MRDQTWLDAADEPYEPMPLRHGLLILAIVAYGGLLVFLAGDGRHGWFAAAAGVPSACYFAWRALARAIDRYDGTAPRDHQLGTSLRAGSAGVRRDPRGGRSHDRRPDVPLAEGKGKAAGPVAHAGTSGTSDDVATVERNYQSGGWATR